MNLFTQLSLYFLNRRSLINILGDNTDDDLKILEGLDGKTISVTYTSRDEKNPHIADNVVVI